MQLIEIENKWALFESRVKHPRKGPPDRSNSVANAQQCFAFIWYPFIIAYPTVPTWPNIDVVLECAHVDGKWLPALRWESSKVRKSLIAKRFLWTFRANITPPSFEFTQILIGETMPQVPRGIWGSILFYIWSQFERVFFYSKEKKMENFWKQKEMWFSWLEMTK